MIDIMLAEAAGGATLDTNVLTQIIDMCKTLMGLFTEFPLNFMLIGGLAGIGFAIFRKAKGAAGGGK